MHYTTLFLTYEGRFRDDFPSNVCGDGNEKMMISAVDSAIPREIMARKLEINKSWHTTAATTTDAYIPITMKWASKLWPPVKANQIANIKKDSSFH